MQVVEQQQVTQNVIVDTVCDICGKSCVDRHGNVEKMDLFASWGYGSKHDSEIWSADICESCVDEKFGFIKFSKQDNLNY